MHLLAVIEIGWGKMRNEALVLTVALHGIVPSRTSRCHERGITAAVPVGSSGVYVA